MDDTPPIDEPTISTEAIVDGKIHVTTVAVVTKDQLQTQAARLTITIAGFQEKLDAVNAKIAQL